MCVSSFQTFIFRPLFKPSMKYKFIPELATADVAFEAYGKTVEELFVNAALAVSETMVKLDTVNPKIEKKLTFENEKLEQLLFDFLEEIVFIKDADYMLFSEFEVKIEKNNKYKLTVTLRGEEINPEKHVLGNDVKAITMHQFKVEQTKDGWKATVIVDV